MGYLQALGRKWRGLVSCTAVLAVILVAGTECRAQNAPANKPSDDALSQELSKHPGLMAEFGRLLERIEKNLKLPAPRSESRLLQLLPESTVAYVAYPNYGDALHQALGIFRQERAESAVLNDWWKKGEMATEGPKLEESLEKIYQLSQYLGDEMVISGSKDGQELSVLIVAEVRKPGLKAALEQMVSDFSGKSPPGVIVFDQEELEIAKDRKPGKEAVVLVRPDVMVGASDVRTLRSFNARLDQKARGFASAAFGQRIARAYQDSVSIVGAADLEKLLTLLPITKEQDRAAFQRSGFADMKYLVWEHATMGGHDTSQAELSFVGPRHGVAAWLGASAPLRSLDFVSPRAIVAGSIVLNNPAQIYDDVQEIARASNPNAFASVTQMEQGLKLSLKEDLLRLLGGEITAEMDSFSESKPLWKAMVQVNDPVHMQKTLGTLLAVANIKPEQADVDGVTYYTVRVPSAEKPTEIHYTFEDGYWVIAPSREAVAETVRLHRAGDSLGKSKRFQAALPPGHAPGASALFYRDTAALTKGKLPPMPQEMAETLARWTADSTPAVVCAYGEETAIREAGTSATFDAGLLLVAAAVAIPNLLRSRVAANEASAVGTIRTINTAQVTYSITYEKRGWAPDLATLGPDASGGDKSSADHADLLDPALGNASCKAGAWCEKSGYRFTLRTICIQLQCTEYTVTGTPVSTESGSRSFCSTSDGVIHYTVGPPLTAPVRASECRKWDPLQ